MAQDSGRHPKPRLARLYAWWYTCIGLGFVSLAVRNWIAHTAPWTIVLRFVIAAGFLLLGYATFRSAQGHSGSP